jgi:uncharacterized caspase-like protein/uncharacterized protein YgiM (DUF1202 family)
MDRQRNIVLLAILLAGGLVSAASWMPRPALAQSSGLEVTLRASEAQGAPSAETVRLYGASHALVIGIDAYSGGWPPLSMAIKDAELVAEALGQAGFEVTLTRDLKSAELVATLKEFFAIKGQNPEARLFVWFAGHGHTLNNEGFLVPADAPAASDPRFLLTAVPIRDFGTFTRLARAKHVFAVFDSCFAGTIFDSARSPPPPAITRATTKPVRQFLTSGDADQKVSDNGRFRDLFLRALRGEERADANDDGYVTASEIGLYLSDRVTNLTRRRQVPRYGKLRDEKFDQGDFVFAVLRDEISKQLSGGTQVVPSAPTPDTSAAALELEFWQSIKNSNSSEEFGEYLRRYPNGTFSGLARQRMALLSPKSQPALSPMPGLGVAIEPIDREYIAVGAARVRERPDVTSKQVAVLKEGQAIHVQGKVRDDAWYLVGRDNKALGYVAVSLLEEASAWRQRQGEIASSVDPMSSEGFAKLGASVYRAPSSSASVVGRIAPGGQVNVTGRVRGHNWYRVAWSGGGESAYVSGEQIAILGGSVGQFGTGSGGAVGRSAPSSTRSIYVEPVVFRGQPLPRATEIIRSGLSGIPNSVLAQDATRSPRDTVVVGSITKLSPRYESNPDFAGAALARSIFGALGAAVTASIPENIAIFEVEVTIDVEEGATGARMSEKGQVVIKFDARLDARPEIDRALERALNDATDRIAVRMAGGRPSARGEPVIIDRVPRRQPDARNPSTMQPHTR